MSLSNPFLERFAALVPQPGMLEGLVVPTRKTEEFRFFDLKPIVDVDWVAPQPDAFDVADWFINEAASATVVVRNGTIDPAASSVTGLPHGCWVGSMAALPVDLQAVVADQLATRPDALASDVFSTLNEATGADPVCVVIPADTIVEQPIAVLYVASGAEAYAAPRLVILAGAGAKASVIEDFRSASDSDRTFTNAFTKVALSENANVHHVRVQREGAGARHVSRVIASVGKFARYDSVHITLGALSSRNDVWVSHDGEDGWSRIDGLAMVDGEREADTHSVIDNTRVRCQSHQLHKCVVDGRGHAVFNGKIFVRSGAQNIDAYQLNRNLLLSPRAKVDTKPQLEIWADDVRCTHGATIGQLDDEQLFYLQSRGLAPDQAYATLTYAFAAEVINSIEVPSLARALEETARARTMHRGQS